MNLWIDSNNKLQQMCDQLAEVATIAVDTEFIRTDTFFPKIALIQISNGDQCWLIDVLAIDQFESLKVLLEDPSRTLIFHACAEDLEVLDHALDIRPVNIFDTQIAAGITNIGYCMGYARLVHKLFDVELDKQETRSDWLKRPLTDRQLDYAAVDVLYLHRIHEILSQALQEQQRQEWFAEETVAMFDMAAGRKDNSDYYLRVKGAWRLQGKSLSALRRLCDWREETARTMDKPRSHIIKDTILLEIARRLPTAEEQLHGIEDWYSRSVKRYGSMVLQQIQYSADDAPTEAIPEPLTKAANTVMKAMRSALSVVAEAQKIPQEFLSNKKELEAILRSALDGDVRGQYEWPARLNQGWREASVKPAIQAVLESTDTLQ